MHIIEYSKYCSFEWTPRYDQSGVYELEFSITDGVNTSVYPCTITVLDTKNEYPGGFSITPTIQLLLLN